MTINIKEATLNLLSNLSSRQKEIIERRFGLFGRDKETLENIGEHFGITRERVRQIQNNAIKNIQKKLEEKEIKEIFNYFENYLLSLGGIRRKDLFLKALGNSDLENEISFLISLDKKILEFKENEKLFSFYALFPESFEKVNKICDSLESYLQKENKLVQKDEILKLFSNEKPEIVLSAINISKNIKESYLQGYGLVSWPEVSPKSINDRIYIVLEKEGKPLHFKEITELCNNLFANGARKFITQTVHNELIKDKRFVLIGRGIYALKKWGYEEGTVKELIYKILKEQNKPLTKEEILQKILEQRKIKPATVLVNLYDKKYFQRDEQGRYFIKTSLI
jgi:DNA-directed RNA polymerase delta subunit